MSFSITTKQMYAGDKSVTRRMGWADLIPGTIITAVEKGMGLKKGQKIKRICQIKIISNRQERLSDITQADVIREGFPDMTTDDFIEMFCDHNNCFPHQKVNRIEFEYIPGTRITRQ
ncbi:MAG: hypothetical protein JXN64_00320 [Spirochaetes bacterium]|nr:hypothetical protein [Spirochaetota bacterium]